MDQARGLHPSIGRNLSSELGELREHVAGLELVVPLRVSNCHG
jgi:hypothetical protein